MTTIIFQSAVINDGQIRVPTIQITLGQYLEREINVACLFELRVIGEKILMLKLDDNLQNLILAWQSRWKLVYLAIGRNVQTDGIYTQVLEHLRKREEEVREENQRTQETVREYANQMERLVMRMRISN